MRWDSICTQQLGLQVFWPVPVCTTRKALFGQPALSMSEKLPHALLSALRAPDMEQNLEIPEQEDSWRFPGFSGTLCAQDL